MTEKRRLYGWLSKALAESAHCAVAQMMGKVTERLPREMQHKLEIRPAQIGLDMQIYLVQCKVYTYIYTI